MKMALPRGMFWNGSRLWVRKDVPKPVREIIGQCPQGHFANRGRPLHPLTERPFALGSTSIILGI